MLDGVSDNSNTSIDHHPMCYRIDLCVFLLSLALVQPNVSLTLFKNGMKQKWIACDKHDGFGAQLMCQFAAYAKARHDGDCFQFSGFDEGGFHDNSRGEGLGEFSGLKSSENCGEGDGEVNYISHPAISPEGGSEQYFTKGVRDELRAFYYSTKKPKIDDSCQVAYHVRRGDVGPDEKETMGSGEVVSRYTSIEVIEHVIKTHFANQKVCLFSEGSPSDFGHLQEMSNVEFKLNLPVGETFHAFVTAPSLVIDFSSLSGTAALLNNGQVYYRGEPHVAYWFYTYTPLSAWKRLQVPESM